MKKILGAAAAVLAFASGAHASVIPTLTSITPSGADYTFNYQAALAPDQGLTQGDQLAIIDFTGYVAGSVSSTNADWSASVSNTLPSSLILPPNVTDNPAVPDLIFTYIGPNFQVTNGPYLTQTNYLGLSAVSTLGGTQLGSFSADAVKNSGQTQDTITYNVGSVATPSGAPEPASWGLMLMGLGGVGAVLRNRRRKAAVA